MTEKEKAEAYDKAIERAKKLYGNGVTEDIFPELKEDDTERIRENCIHFLELQKQHHAATFEIEECIDWLEKQGEQKPCMIQWKGDNLKEVISFTGKDKNFEKWFKSFEEYEKYVHEHNDIFKLFNENGNHYEIPVGAWIVKTPDGYNIASNAVLKQKSADKIEPKFKVGDWITSNLSNSSNLLRIIGIDETNYEVVTPQGSSGVPSIRYIDKHFHLWTIEDVRDGDVLVHSSFMFDDFIFIYNNTSILQAYCYYSNEKNRFIIEDRGHPCPWNMQEVTPATKGQRELLFQKIKESGYEWDTEKKN